MKTRRERIRMTENGKNGGKREREVIFICKDCSRLKNNSISSHFERNNNTSYNMCFKSGLTLRTSLSVLVLLGMHLASLVPYSEGFNLDTVKALKFDGPNSESYFGFTVEMMNKDSRNKWYVYPFNSLPTERNFACFLLSADFFMWHFIWVFTVSVK